MGLGMGPGHHGPESESFWPSLILIDDVAESSCIQAMPLIADHCLDGYISA